MVGVDSGWPICMPSVSTSRYLKCKRKSREERMIARIQVTFGGSGRSHLEGSLMLGRQVGDNIFILSMA